MQRWLGRLLLGLVVFFALPVPVAASAVALHSAVGLPPALVLPPTAAVIEGESHLEHRPVAPLGALDEAPQLRAEPPSFWRWLQGHLEATPQWLVNFFKGVLAGVAGGLLALGALLLAGLFVPLGSLSALAFMVGGALFGGLYGLLAGTAFSWLVAVGAGLLGGVVGWGLGFIGGLGALFGKARGLLGGLLRFLGRLRWPWGREPAWRWLLQRFVTWGGPALVTGVIAGSGVGDSLFTAGLVGLLGVGAELLVPPRVWYLRDTVVYGAEAYLRRWFNREPLAAEPEPEPAPFEPAPSDELPPTAGGPPVGGVVVPPAAPAPVEPAPAPGPVVPLVPVVPGAGAERPPYPAPVWPGPPAWPWPSTSPAEGYVVPPFVFVWPGSPGSTQPTPWALGPVPLVWLPSLPLLVVQFWWFWLHSWPGLLFAPWGWYGPWLYPGWALLPLPAVPTGWPVGWGLGLELAPDLAEAGD